MSKLLNIFIISLIILTNQDFVYGARVQSLSKDDNNSPMSLSEPSKSDDKEKKEDLSKDKEKR